MAKRRKQPDPMGVFLSGGRTQSEHGRENTQGTQTEHIENTQRTRFDEFKKTELETFSVRLSAEDKRKLREYFEKRSIPMSQGIRSIVIEFMEERGLK